ncbi:MAG TPA: GAF domain-containing protein, partial [Anaerolineales bacterium]|nr:GAF domain-containing protein [Anaerolineales bacterium]
DTGEIERAEQAGRQIAIAMWSVQQDIALKKRLKEQETLAQITTTLSQVEHVGLSNVLDLIVHAARELIPEAQQAVIHLMDRGNAYLTPQAVSGYEQTSESGGKMRVGEGAAGLAMSEGKSVYIPSIHTDERFIHLSSQVKYNSLLVTPIISSSQKLGTISIQSEKAFAFSKSAINLLNELGQQAAIAIENTRLYDAAQQELKERFLAEAALRSSEERYRSVSEDIPAMICRFDRGGTLTYVNQAYADFFGGTPSELINKSFFDMLDEEQKDLVRSNFSSLTPDKPFIVYEIHEKNCKGEKRWVQWTDRLITNENDIKAEYQSIGMDITDRKLAEIEREHLLEAEHDQRLRAETSAEATLALVSHVELDKVLIEILNQVQRLLPGCGANIALLENNILRTAAWRGYENRGEEVFKNLIKDTGMYPLDQTMIKNPKTSIIADTALDENWITIPGLEWIRSHLCIPLLWNKQLLGLLYIDENAP